MSVSIIFSAGTDEDSDASSSDDSDITDTDEGSESESAVYDLDVCPSGCDQVNIFIHYHIFIQ